MEYFSEKLTELKKKHLYRKPITTSFISDNIVTTPSASLQESSSDRDNPKKKLLSFCSNDYLGLANNRSVKKAAIRAVKKYGASSKSSRYITGNNEIYQDLEQKLAKFYDADDSIVFSSGYQSAIGTIPALAQKGDLIIADKLIHSCLIDGAKLSGAKLLRYSHNDITHLENLLKENKDKYDKTLIITEEIFSMDGDLAPLNEIQELAKENKALLLVDCAHSLYEAGLLRLGYSAPRNDHEGFEVIFLGTMSKSLGSFGGYVTGSSIIIDYLRNFAKSAIYTTALPPATLAASLESLNIISKKNLARKTLDNARYLCELLKIPFKNSAIIIIEIGDVEKTLRIAKNLKEQGLIVSSIRPPTSPTARLRITVNTKHKKKEIESLARKLKDILKEENVSF